MNTALVDTNLLKDLNGSNILAPEYFEAVKYEAYNLIDSKDRDGAILFSRRLETILLSIQSPSNQVYFKALYFWMFRLKLFSFVGLSASEQTDIFKRYIASMLSLGLDVKQVIYNYIDNFSAGDIIEKITKGIITDLLSSTAVLGSGQALKSGSFSPAVGNWLREYQPTLSAIAGRKTEPDTFHIIKFMDSDKYAKLLGGNEKEILRDLLDLYNWLLSPVVYVDEKVQTQSTPYVTGQKYNLPKEMFTTSEKPLPPVVPAPKRAPLRPINEIRKDIIDGQAAIGGSQKQEQASEGYVHQNYRRVNIQDILKKKDGQDDIQAGLRIGQAQQPSSLKEELFASHQDKAKKQMDIDKKLEELKKRIKK